MIRRNLFLAAMVAVVLTLVLFVNVPARSAKCHFGVCADG